MHPKFYYFLLLSLCPMFIISCSNTEHPVSSNEIHYSESTLDSLAISIETDSINIFLSEVRINRMLCVNDRLYVCNNSPVNDTMIYHIDLKTGDRAKEVGAGTGPDEVVNPTQINSLNGNLQIYDRGQKEIKNFSNGKATFTSRKENNFNAWSIDLADQMISFPAVIENDSALLSGSLVDSRLIIRPNNTTEQEYAAPFPEPIHQDQFSTPTEVMHMAYDGIPTINPDGTLFAIAGTYVPMVEVYDPSGDLKKRIYLGELFDPVFSNSSTVGGIKSAPIRNITRRALTGITTTEASIYVSYHGGLIFKKDIPGITDYHNHRLIELSWSGELMGVYDTNQGFYRIAVNESDRTLYALSDEKSKRQLVKFKL